MSKQKRKRKSTFQAVYKLGLVLLKSQMFLAAKKKLFGPSPELFAVQMKVDRLKKGLVSSKEVIKEMKEIGDETRSIIEASKRAVGSTPDTMEVVMTSRRLEEIHARVGAIESKLNVVFISSSSQKR